MSQVVLTQALRTAVGDFEGTLKSFSAVELGRLVIDHVAAPINDLSIGIEMN